MYPGKEKTEHFANPGGWQEQASEIQRMWNGKSVSQKKRNPREFLFFELCVDSEQAKSEFNLFH
jgi:hypothetical protein